MARFTTQDKVNILTLLLSGERKNELCRRYAIDKKELTIWQLRLRRYGLRGLRRLSQRHWTEAQKREAVRAFLQADVSLREMAVRLNVSLSTLKNWVRRYREQSFLSKIPK